ncbi:hypothetical protein [Mycobacterium interjectum]|uniref:hypothetical protein n=1 Tax=Mycobacterium interjectum TaxID=33895 RepID=UPI000A76ABEC|nr:hypothetical protein [Mycobacterium interjectum]MCV7088532.1 hypothetical protein [Mycobacterium interjectum]
MAYAAPEQLMGQELDGRADQYALAANAFHLLTSAPPYQQSNPVAIIDQHLNAAIPKSATAARIWLALTTHYRERWPRIPINA